MNTKQTKALDRALHFKNSVDSRISYLKAEVLYILSKSMMLCGWGMGMGNNISSQSLTRDYPQFKYIVFKLVVASSSCGLPVAVRVALQNLCAYIKQIDTAATEQPEPEGAPRARSRSVTRFEIRHDAKRHAIESEE